MFSLEDRIEWVDPTSITLHDANPRQHPEVQHQALGESVDELGWVKPLIINRTTGRLLDGHARVKLAIKRDEQVPVVFVNIDADKEKYALVSLDAVTLLATYDEALLTDLLLEIETKVPEYEAMLSKLAALDIGAQLSGVDADYESETPDGFGSVDVDGFGFDHECPKCGYEW